MAAPVDRLQQLEAIEKEIANSLQFAGQAVQELSKDKPSIKQMEGHTTNFLKTLESVENGLSKQITYLTQVSTGQPHECSSYAAQKVLQMAWHRLEHARSRFGELERINVKYCPPGHLQQVQQQQQQQGQQVGMQPRMQPIGMQQPGQQQVAMQQSNSMMQQPQQMMVNPQQGPQYSHHQVAHNIPQAPMRPP